MTRGEEAMPVKGRSMQREARKKKVLLAFRKNKAMTAAQVAAACGWPVAVTTRIIAALAAEPKPRLRKAGHVEVKYDRVEKPVSVYSVPAEVDPMALPAWLRGPCPAPEPLTDDEEETEDG